MVRRVVDKNCLWVYFLGLRVNWELSIDRIEIGGPGSGTLAECFLQCRPVRYCARIGGQGSLGEATRLEVRYYTRAVGIRMTRYDLGFDRPCTGYGRLYLRPGAFY